MDDYQQVKIDKCPVCKSKLDNSLCPTCGWVQINYAGEIPKLLADMEVRRLEIARKLYAEYTQDKGQLTELDQRLKDVNLENEKMKKEIEELKAAPANAPQAPSTVGIVLVTDAKNNAKVAASIHEGVNTYGNNETQGQHHRVLLKPFSPKLQPVHFSVERRGKHLLLKDLTGGTMKLNPPTGMNVEGKTIILSNGLTIEFMMFY